MHKLFVTQVYQASLKTDLKDIKKEIFQIEKADVAGQKWSEINYKNGYTSYGSWDQLQQMSSTFSDLEKQIKLHVFKFTKTLDYDLKKNSLKMDSMWVNIMPEGALHTAHIHPHSVISGTFYADIPPRSSAIKFEDPRLGFFMNSPLVKPSAQKDNLRFFSIQPKSGDLVLFESWLKHEVPYNQSKKPRLSVSFNYSWM
ncbi:MAG: TIGR02466 family protein [Pseudobdellovibrio sp.]